MALAVDWDVTHLFKHTNKQIATVYHLHDGTQARVQNEGEYSEPVVVKIWDTQYCVKEPILFSMVFSAMHVGVFQDIDTGCNQASICWQIIQPSSEE